MQDRTFRVMISAEQIDKAVAEVASKLNERYAGREPIFVGVLSGSILFMSDLVRKTTFDSEMTFIKVSSYSGTESTGKVKMELGLNVDIKDRDVIIVEDIVETGHSMKHLLDYFADFNPRSVAICTLFFKPEKYIQKSVYSVCELTSVFGSKEFYSVKSTVKNAVAVKSQKLHSKSPHFTL